MKYFKYIFISSLVIIHSVSAESPSVIGDYHVGFGYQHYSGDGYDGNSFGIDSNLALHQNFDLSTSLSYGQLSDDFIDLNRLALSLGFVGHNKFELGNGSSIDPFIGFNVGMLYTEVLSVQYIGFTPYLFIEDELYIPYNFSLGSEFKLGQFFSLIPYIGFGGVLNESEADTTGYFGLMTNFFLGDYFSIMLNLRGDSDDGTAFGLGLRYHM